MSQEPLQPEVLGPDDEDDSNIVIILEKNVHLVNGYRVMCGNCETEYVTSLSPTTELCFCGACGHAQPYHDDQTEGGESLETDH